jgi:REP-associated tyrosine transposase
MPRPSRLQLAGGVYHVVSRGNRQQAIFCDEIDYARFLELLGAAVSRFGWRCHTYCLMPNHFHLVVETPEANISAGMQWLNGRYAQWFNIRYGFSGHLFQGRFYGDLVESAYHLLELVRYIALNPVRAGLCRDASGWRWSSYRAMVGEAKSTALLTVTWLQAQFGRDLTRARQIFRAFVQAAPARPRPP